MNRKHFLRHGTLAGLSLPVLAAAACKETGNKDKTTITDTSAGGAQVPDAFALSEATIDDLQQKMKSGEYTARSITEL
ncbi:MAG: amidase, partial [Bacteroidetes bacterium]|nr:amidase [Bacteroidota bacterium]